MKKTKGRLCLVQMWLLAAISELYADQIDLLQQQVQTLTTQARLSDVLIKQLLEKVDNAVEELKAMKQQWSAANHINDDALTLSEKQANVSKVSKTDNRIEQLEQQVSTFAREKTELAKMLRQAIEVIDSLKGKSGNASTVCQEQLGTRQEKFFKFNFTVKCSLAGAQSENLTRLSNGKKYFFSDPIQGNWTFADEYCKGMGLHLATIRDQADLDETWSRFQSSFSYPVYWWLSAKNYGSGKKSDFRWHDGSKLPLMSNLWRENAKKLKGCVYSSNGGTQNLNDGSCSLNMYFICELPSECY
ncbi:C-type lectin domain family 4 member M-like isoform X2 [Neocloeon triangulifer]|uniref:C-type lectin domain family 4 member M-like isoform X2 n=1 Tax=Neocloeon triangulifer TaxID=2078957 RepID=UPI00286EE96C|nr:C-type lectin domain family 4 member M-like isoform X2 [Neocloeon triangulifer]